MKRIWIFSRGRSWTSIMPRQWRRCNDIAKMWHKAEEKQVWSEAMQGMQVAKVLE